MRDIFVKRLTFITVTLIVCFCMFAACRTNKIDYPVYKVTDNKQLNVAELNYSGIVYRFYGSLPDGESEKAFLGEKIGIRDDSSDFNDICEVKGYDSKEWIISYQNNMMGGCSLYKAVDGTDVPFELEKFKDKDLNW